LQPLDKPSALHSAYAEPEALRSAPDYRGTTLLEGLLGGAQRVSRNHPGAHLGIACLVTDAGMLTAAAAVGLLWAADLRTEYLTWSAAFGLLALLLFGMRRAYTPRLALRPLDDLARVIAVTASAAMAIISLRVLLGGDHVAQTAHYWLFATAFVAVGRVALLGAEARARRRGAASRPTLIVGAGTVGRLAARRLSDRPELGLRPIGFLDKDPVELDGNSPSLPVLGASWDLDHVIAEHGVRHVVVSFSTAPHHVLLDLIRRCRELGVPVSVVPRLFEIEADRVSVERLGGLPLITMQAANPKGWLFRTKYGVERLVAALALLVTLPLFIGAMIVIRLTMGTPVLFRQARIGSDGRVFNMLKLRTMKGNPEDDGEADIDWALEQLAESGPPARAVSQSGPSQTPADDRRTVLGRMLRRFSLDELPQLWNVVRGDMSLVGPRPERVSYARRFERSIYRYGDRHRVRSGITGWAQVNGLRGRTSLSDRVEWDNYYIENWSPWLDTKIILMTVACVLRGEQRDRADEPFEPPLVIRDRRGSRDGEPSPLHEEKNEQR
jgi:exopolysaccharide biosynthesis polyprenyl glycosylphosphotransferase